MGKWEWTGEDLVSLQSFGELTIHRGDERIDDRVPTKAAAMLVYLADQGGKVRRTTMAGLLWSDQTEERARANLRVILTRLRRELADVLDADRDWIRLDGPFRLDASELSEATGDDIASMYQADFLDQLELPGAELFHDWAATRRADLRATAISRLREAAATAQSNVDWTRCERLATALISIDPWDELAHQWKIESIFHTSGPADSQAHAERFASELERELGVSPSQETMALVGALAAKAPEPDGSSISIPDQALPPRWSTSLVGRSGELLDIERRVRPGRPLSIVGPGGIGKSRLLAEYARQAAAAGQTVAYVGFDSHAPTEEPATERAFAETVLVALGVPANSERGPVESLHRYLQNADMLLCLDNLEHLEGIERALTTLGQQCPTLSIVLTTRRRPILVQGQVIELRGLGHRSEPDLLSPAEDLFLDRSSSRVHNDDALGLVGAICKALDGHPLAIELAAHWAETASIAELAELLSEAEAGPTLETSAPDVPSRHRSLDVLVTASLDQVSDRARRVLRAAAFFAGPFTSDDVIAMVPLLKDELAELVRHSLVVADDGFYHLHPLIRRFARHRLETTDSPDELARRHAMQMVSVMETIRDPLNSGLRFQRRAADLRVAIDWLIDRAEPDQLLQPLSMYLGFQRTWGWFVSSKETIARALERTDLAPVARAELHRHAAEAMLHGARYRDAVNELEHGLDLVGSRIPAGTWQRRWWTARQAAVLAVAPLRLSTASTKSRAAERARLMSLLGEVFYVSDRRNEMMSYGLGSLSAGRVSRDPVLGAAGDAGIAVACQLAGAHRLAERYRRRARRRATNVTPNPFTACEMWAIAALVAVGSGHWDEARVDTARAIGEGAVSGRTRMISQLDILLAIVDYHEGRFEDALDRLDRAESSLERNGFRRALTWVHATAAESALALGDLERARDRAALALAVAKVSGRPEDEARAHVSLARCALRDNNVEMAKSSLHAATDGLASPSALAIQHFELHCGGASAARELVAIDPHARPVLETFEDRLASYTKAFPIARGRAKSDRERSPSR